MQKELTPLSHNQPIMTDTPTIPLLKLSNVATQLQISKDTIKRYEREKLIKPIRKGTRRDRFFTQENIKEIIAIRKKKKEQYKKNALYMQSVRMKNYHERKKKKELSTQSTDIST